MFIPVRVILLIAGVLLLLMLLVVFADPVPLYLKSADPVGAQLDDLHRRLVNQQQQLDKIENTLESLNEPGPDLSSQPKEKNAEPDWSFWGTVSLTILTLLVTLGGALLALAGTGVAIYFAFRQLINFDERMGNLAQKKVDELNSFMEGRLLGATAHLFYELAWKRDENANDYVQRPSALGSDYGRKALETAQRSTEAYKKVGRDEKKYKQYEWQGLNRLVFYTTLMKRDKITPEVAHEVLALADQLKKVETYKDQVSFISTVGYAYATFYQYLGSGTCESIDWNLTQVKETLSRAIDEIRPPESTLLEAKMILRHLERARTKNRKID